MEMSTAGLDYVLSIAWDPSILDHVLINTLSSVSGSLLLGKWDHTSSVPRVRCGSRTHSGQGQRRPVSLSSGST